MTAAIARPVSASGLLTASDKTLFRHDPGSDELPGDRLIPGDLLEPPAAREVRPRVADVRDEDPFAADDCGGERRPHPRQLRVEKRFGPDPPVHRLHGSFEELDAGTGVGEPLHLELEGLERQRARDLSRVVPSQPVADREEDAARADGLIDDDGRLEDRLPRKVADDEPVLVAGAAETGVGRAVGGELHSANSTPVPPRVLPSQRRVLRDG